MTDDRIIELERRLAQLENTVAHGFLEAGGTLGAAMKEERTARLASEQELRDHFDQVTGDLADSISRLKSKLSKLREDVDTDLELRGEQIRKLEFRLAEYANSHIGRIIALEKKAGS